MNVNAAVYVAAALPGRNLSMTAQVIAPTKSDPIPDLKHLTIVQAPDNENLAPLDARTRLTAKIPTTGLLPDDKLRVSLVGGPGSHPGGSYTSPLLDVGSSSPRILNLNKEVVAFLLKNIMTLTFKITRAGVTSPDSEPLELKVLELQEGALEKGRIFGKDDDGTGPALDLRSTEDRTARIGIWPLIAIGQWVWFVLTGEDEKGEPYELILFEGQVDQALITLGYIEVIVLFSCLKPLGDETDVKLQYWVAFDQVKDKSKAHSSQVRSYTVKSTTLVRPEITGMTDLNGVALHNGAVASTRGVILTGTAGANQKVRIFLYSTEIDRVVADSKGKWEYRFERRDSHLARLGAKASDGSYSAIRLVWFAEAGRPVITGLTDSRGESIPEYSATFDSTVTLTGTADPDREVEILGNRLPTPVDSAGVWRHTLTGLNTGRHVIAVRALYGENPISYSWVLYAVAVRTPVITSITDSLDRVIPSHGSTFDQTVKLIGTASANVNLTIFLESIPCDFVKADAEGAWCYTLVLPAQPPYGYRFMVQTLDGSGAQSPEAVIYSMAAIEPMTLVGT